MATSNENLRDLIVRHQIGLMRVSNRLRRQILNTLQRTERDLGDRIIARTSVLARNGGANINLDPRTNRRLRQIERTIREIRSPAFEAIGDNLRDELQEVALGEPAFLTNAIRTVVPVDFQPILPSPAELRAIVRSRPFQGRVLRQWASKLERDDRLRIMNEIRIGLTQAQDPLAIAARIVGTRQLGGSDGANQLTRNQAEAVVRTSINHIGNAVRREFALANRRFFSQEEYVAVLDKKTSLICRSLDGNIYDIGAGPYPPVHHNCRSIRVPYIERGAAARLALRPTEQRRLLRQFADENGLEQVRTRTDLPRRQRRAFDQFARRSVLTMVGGIPDDRMTQDSFLAGLNNAEQADVLGVSKARLVRRGGLSLGRLVDRRGTPLTLPELATRERAAFERAGLDPDDFIES